MKKTLVNQVGVKGCEILNHKVLTRLLPVSDGETKASTRGDEHVQPCIHGKKVFAVDTRILNPDSDFRAKLLCDGPTFSPGSACVYSCQYCYVETMMNRGGSAVAETLAKAKQPFDQVVIRRQQPLHRLRHELRDSRGALLYKEDKGVVYASPAVDVAATVELADETVGLCLEILQSTGWTIRLLSKSPLLGRVARAIPDEWKNRMIFGLSTGTLNDRVAAAIEPDAPPPSKRLATLRELQDEGYRTFAMLCPILPQDPIAYTNEVQAKISLGACEHVWAEVLNRRGNSMNRTFKALADAHLTPEAQALRHVFGQGSTPSWEQYARGSFLALANIVPPGKLRFLQYVTTESKGWWTHQQERGAVLLGKAVALSVSGGSAVNVIRSAAAKKAWDTIRSKRAGIQTQGAD